MDKNINNQNEISALGTHEAGATDLQQTRKTDKPVQIEDPVIENPGRYDTRTGKYDPPGEYGDGQ